MAETSIKSLAKQLVDQLPDNASWNDLAYAIYVRQSIEAGVQDIQQGRFQTHDQVREKFGLNR